MSFRWLSVGETSTWFITGLMVDALSNRPNCSLLKFDTPMLRTRPFSTSASIARQVSTKSTSLIERSKWGMFSLVCLAPVLAIAVYAPHQILSVTVFGKQLGVADIRKTERPMNKIQINVIQFQIVQWQTTRLLDAFRLVERIPQLRVETRKKKKCDLTCHFYYNSIV